MWNIVNIKNSDKIENVSGKVKSFIIHLNMTVIDILVYIFLSRLLKNKHFMTKYYHNIETFITYFFHLIY